METSIDADTLNKLLDGSNGGSVDSLSLFNFDALMPFFIALTVVSGLLTILILINAIRRWRVDSAILDSHKILREMNERQKHASPQAGPKTPPNDAS